MDMSQVMWGETLIRIGVGNFVADNIVTSLNAEGRPTLVRLQCNQRIDIHTVLCVVLRDCLFRENFSQVGIRSCEWGPSSRMDDLALAMLSVFNINKDINRYLFS
jgi:hypothetical protein